MKKTLLTFVFAFISIALFSQKTSSRDAAILKLMNVKRGMASVNSLPDNMSKNMSEKDATSFKAELSKYKTQLINTALETFKKDYTAKEIDFIYNECTSDKIDYTDLTNGFFRKWRQLKGNLYFRHAKETYAKYM